jgi:hypothetical protein
MEKDEKVKVTIRLPKQLVKWAKSHAARREQEFQNVVELAVWYYLSDKELRARLVAGTHRPGHWEVMRPIVEAYAAKHPKKTKRTK